jgi:hypothetical protein
VSFEAVGSGLAAACFSDGYTWDGLAGEMGDRNGDTDGNGLRDGDFGDVVGT